MPTPLIFALLDLMGWIRALYETTAVWGS